MFLRRLLLDRPTFFLVGTIAMSALISPFMCSPAESVTIESNFISLAYVPSSATVIEGGSVDFTVQITNKLDNLAFTFQSITPQGPEFIGGDMDDAIRNGGSFQGLPFAIPPGRFTLVPSGRLEFTHHVETTDQSGVNDHDAGVWRIGTFAAFEVNLGNGIEVQGVATTAIVTVVDPPFGAIPEPSTYPC